MQNAECRTLNAETFNIQHSAFCILHSAVTKTEDPSSLIPHPSSFILPMRLVLFDIDGTLLTDRGAARDAYGEALGRVYGYAGDLRRYDFSGRTDPQITYMVLRDAGLADAEIAAKIDELWERYLAGLARNATPERVRVLPGIPALLDALASR